MPVERGYESQVMPKAGAPMPSTSPDVFGANIGQAMAGAGETLHRAQLQSYQMERRRTADQEAADFQHRFAQLRDEMDQESRTARADAQPGGAGHGQTMRAAIEARRETLFEGITEDSVRQQAEASFGDYAGRFTKGEDDFEEGLRVGKLVTDIGQVTQIGANRARRSHTQEAYGEELRLGFEAIDALQGVPADVRDRLKREHEQAVTVAFVSGLNDSNPVVAKTLIDAGAFDARLDPDQLIQLRNGSEVEIRRAEAQQEQAQAHARAQVMDNIQTIRTLAGQGVDVTDQMPAAIAAAQAMGDNSLVAELQGIQRDTVFARVYTGVTPMQRERRMAALGSKAQRSADEDRELNWLRTHSNSLDSQFNTDPVGFAAANSTGANAPPPINWSDPASIAARRQWVRSASVSFGRTMPFLSDNEVAPMRARAAESPAGQMEVADALAMLGGRDAINAARQVAPNDALLQRLVTVPADMRRMVRAGNDVRVANRMLVDGQHGQMARRRFDAVVGRALSQFPDEQRAAIFEMSRSLYAAAMSRAGTQDYSDAAFTSWVERALGGRIGRWGSRNVVLPQGMSQAQFENVLTRYRPGNGPTAPVLRNGQPMTGQQLRAYTPVLRPDGLYQFEAPDGSVVANRGRGIYTMDLTP